MDNSTFSQNQIPNHALVVLSEAASGLHEVLRNQRPIQNRIPDAKQQFHNMSIMGSYGTHLLHNFPSQLLQSFNPSLLVNSSAGNFFANERLMSESMLSNLQFSSAFTPPKYIGIPIEQNLFNGCESFRTASTSPTCTSQDSLEGHQENENEKDRNARNNSEVNDKRQFHILSKQNRGFISEFCPVCGIQLAPEDWNSHFLTELDRLYKLSCGVDQNFDLKLYHNSENMMRPNHNRWETFQRIQNNRQGRFKIRVRKRKCGRDLFFMENLFCRSCPICRRKFALDSEEHMDELKEESKQSVTDIDEICECVSGSDTTTENLDGNSYTAIESEERVSNSNNIWEINMSCNEKNKMELPSTTHEIYMADSCEEINYFEKNEPNNDSDEDIIVDDEICKPIKKPRCENQRQVIKSSSDDSYSEPQVSSSEETEILKNSPNPDENSIQFTKNNNQVAVNDIKEFQDYKCFTCFRRSSSLQGTKHLCQQCCTHN